MNNVDLHPKRVTRILDHLNAVLDGLGLAPVVSVGSDRNIYRQSTEVAVDVFGKTVVVDVPDYMVEPRAEQVLDDFLCQFVSVHSEFVFDDRPK